MTLEGNSVGSTGTVQVDELDKVCAEAAQFIEYLAQETSISPEEQHLLTGAQFALMSSVRRANASTDGGHSRRSGRTN